MQKTIFRVAALFSLLLACIGGTANEIVFEENFNQGLDRWRIFGKQPVIQLTGQGHRGSAVEFTLAADRSVKNNDKWLNAFESKPFPVRKGSFRLTGKIQFPKNFGAGVHVRFYDAAMKRIGYMGTHYGSKPASHKEWLDIDISGASYPDETAFASVGVNFPAWFDMTVRIDDLRLEYMAPGPIPPRWKPAYKLDPVKDAARLTPADFPGPDGIVYPNFYRAGVQAAVAPEAPAGRIRITPDTQDLHGAITRAIAALGKNGGIVELAPGDYRLSRFLYIQQDNIVLKGAGRDKTRIVFDYDTPEAGVELYGMTADTRLGAESSILVVARPGGIEQIRLSVNGHELRRVVRSMHSGNDSFLVGSMKNLPFRPKPGETLKICAEVFRNRGIRNRCEISVVYDEKSQWSAPASRPAGAINIAGRGRLNKPVLLAETAPRGATSVLLTRADHGIRPGDAIFIHAPATKAWKKLTDNACTWGRWRSYIVFVRAVDGARLALDQPLRLEYPLESQPYVDRMALIQRCGVEDFTLEHRTDYWVNSIDFSNAANCHAARVLVRKTGCNPIYGQSMKFCSILDCEMDDAWFKGGGGTAYVGFEGSYDNLLDRVVTRNMRHAPCVQWAGAGNVIRNGVFYGSDAQWHSGWTNENLFENCRILSDSLANGGYGHGLWASAPEDGSHGPNGPRNVVYNCDVFAQKNAVWLGGMNENWIFVGNRFRARQEAGFFIKSHSFDHIIRNNVFILENRRASAVVLATADCGGLDFRGNLISGGAPRTVIGLSEPARNEGNRLVPLDVATPRPQLHHASIYEWQKAQQDKPHMPSAL